MNLNLSSINRRRFLRGTGITLALPLLESFAGFASGAEQEATCVLLHA